MNDLVYNEIVATPGFELEFAVGTTYSLDSEAFLALALSFARMGEVADTDFQSPMRLLEGVRQANEHIAVFCNRGGLKLPVRRNPLYVMLDRSVFEVADGRKGYELANFHPKIWVIKERSLDNPSDRQVKLIVMSRNLTKETSLDIAVTMTAKFAQRNSAKLRRKHEPLKQLLLKLSEYTPTSSNKRKAIRRLANDIDLLGEFQLDAPFESYEFLPFYFGENLNQQIELPRAMQGSRMIVVSPFIDKETLDILNDRTKGHGKVLITRLDSITQKILDSYQGELEEVWASSSIMAQNDIQAMDLHAKMYFVENTKNVSGCHLWIGSANATVNGFHRNSEFLLHLTYQRGQKLFDKFKDEFCNADRQFFQQVTSVPDDTTEQPDQSLSIAIRKTFISHNNLTAQVVDDEEDISIIITAKKYQPIAGTISFAPIQEPDNFAAYDYDNKSCCIKVYNRAHLSEFYILSVEPIPGSKCEPIKMVIKIPTVGIPENRDNLIFQSLVDTQDKFLNYVEMMITDKPYEIIALLRKENEQGNNQVSANAPHRSVALYEAMLKLAATNPDRLQDIDDVITRMDISVIPDSFKQMYDQFKQTIKKLK
jgi:hypothetical protein